MNDSAVFCVFNCLFDPNVKQIHFECSDKKQNKVDHEKTSSRDLDDIVSEMSA